MGAGTGLGSALHLRHQYILQCRLAWPHLRWADPGFDSLNVNTTPVSPIYLLT
jgi:hypothetical protein